MMLRAENLHKSYSDGRDTLNVLKGINLEIEKEKITSIIGPSGAGKSTLLHLLGGLDYPSKGRVIFEGRPLESFDDKRLSELRNKRIGFVFQFYHLLSEFNVWENVTLPGLMKSAILDKSKKYQRAKELLSQIGLGERLAHKPNQLSGGEQQRVAIARALINEPDLLLCDEPTGNLDSENGKSICALLQRLNRENKVTVVLVTHNEELASIAHKKVYLKDGLIISNIKNQISK